MRTSYVLSIRSNIRKPHTCSSKKKKSGEIYHKDTEVIHTIQDRNVTRLQKTEAGMEKGSRISSPVLKTLPPDRLTWYYFVHWVNIKWTLRTPKLKY